MATDSYSQGVPYALLSDTPDAQALGKGIVDALTPRSVMRFTNAAARTAAITAPVAGMVTWLATEKRLDIYDGSAWVDYVGGTWTNYNPQWLADSGSTTVGNGSLTGKYMIHRNTVDFRIKLQWGTTTTQSVAGSNWIFSLPTNVHAGEGTTFWPCTAWALDLSANLRYVCAGYCDSSTTPHAVSALTSDGSSAGFLDNLNPMTWANGDRLNIWGTYELG